MALGDPDKSEGKVAFEVQYPNIAKLLATGGRIELGYHYMIDGFACAYDEGGTIYEGKSSYASVDIALADLDRGIAAYNDQWGIF